MCITVRGDLKLGRPPFVGNEGQFSETAELVVGEDVFQNGDRVVSTVLFSRVMELQE